LIDYLIEKRWRK